ncbi:MAG: type II toxin-antitoxin system VapC family toxin [Rhizobiaceae bacterium]
MIVIDTHVLVWWLSDRSRLSKEALRAVEDALAGDGVAASSISAWEVALLVDKGKLDLSMDLFQWLKVADEIVNFRFVPVDHILAARSVVVPDFHPDPADRIIVSLARNLGAPLVTADEKIRRYPHVRTIW